MNATLLSRAALATLALALLAPTVEARHRYRRPAPAPMCAVAAPVAAPAVAGSATTYQSFSYEPGATAAPAPVMTGRMIMTRPSAGAGRFDEPYLHGDSKASGRYLWNNR